MYWFCQMDPGKNGKENILVMMDMFSKFSAALVSSNWTGKTVTKALVNR